MTTFKKFMLEELSSTEKLSWQTHLKNLDPKTIQKILASHLIITEKLDGWKFSIIKDKNGEISYWTKSNKIDKVTLLTRKTWSVLTDRLEWIRKKTNEFLLLPNNSEVSGEFISSKKHNVITYSTVPKGNWVIFYVRIGDRTYNATDYKVLWKWADYFESEKLPILFEGRLNEKQRENPLKFFSSKFGDTLEGIVIYTDKNSPPIKIVDPYFTTYHKSVWDKPELAQLDKEFVNFMGSWLTPPKISEVKVKITGSASVIPTPEQYISIINELYTEMLKNKNLLSILYRFKNVEKNTGLDMSKVDPLVGKLMTSEPHKYLYVLMLQALKKQKRARVGIFKDIDLVSFNRLIDEIV